MSDPLPNMVVANVPTLPPPDPTKGGQAPMAYSQMQAVLTRVEQINTELAGLSSTFRNALSIWETAPPITTNPPGGSTPPSNQPGPYTPGNP